MQVRFIENYYCIRHIPPAVFCSRKQGLNCPYKDAHPRPKPRGKEVVKKPHILHEPENYNIKFISAIGLSYIDCLHTVIKITKIDN